LISSWQSPAKKPGLASEDSDKSNVATTKLQKCLAGTNAKGVARSSVLGAASNAPIFLRSSRLRSLIFLTGYYLGTFRNNKLLFVAIQDKFEKIPISLI
jgi:hypothetical protein